MRFPPPPPWVTHITPRQFQILSYLADGCTIQQCAARMMISRETAKNHAAALYRRIDVRSQAEAVALGFREGWLH